MLDTPYPWETWDDRDGFATDLQTARRVVARLTGHSPVVVGLCPTCSHNLTARMGDEGRSDEAWCARCGKSWDTYSRPDFTTQGAPAAHPSELTSAQRKALRSIDVDRSLRVTFKELQTVWDGEVPSKTIESWAQRRHLIRRDGKILLWFANAWIAEKLKYEAA